MTFEERGSAEGKEGGSPNLSEKKNPKQLRIILSFIFCAKVRLQRLEAASKSVSPSEHGVHSSSLCTVSFIHKQNLFPFPKLSFFNCGSQTSIAPLQLRSSNMLFVSEHSSDDEPEQDYSDPHFPSTRLQISLFHAPLPIFLCSSCLGSSAVFSR